MGLKKYQNGDIYEGIWKDDKKNGSGSYKHINGDFYLGKFLNENYHGYGIYKYSNHKEFLNYEGFWSHNKK